MRGTSTYPPRPAPVPPFAGSAPTPDDGEAARLPAEATASPRYGAAAWNRGDLDGFMAGYKKAPSLTFFSGDTITEGWQQTLDRYKAHYQAGGAQMGQLTFTDQRIDVLSPTAVVTGSWELEIAGSGKRPGGVFTLLWRKFDDGWKIVHDHTSARP